MGKKQKSTKLAIDKKSGAAPFPALTPVSLVPKTVTLRSETKPEIDSDGACLNFRVRTSFRRDFRRYAADHVMKLNEVLRAAFEALKRANL